MIRLLADENFNNDIVRGVRRRLPNCELSSVHELQLDGTSDPDLLAWAVQNPCVIVTHDVNTFPAHAYERIKAGLQMRGLLIVPNQMAIGSAIDDILIVVQCTEPDEWHDQVQFLPL